MHVHGVYTGDKGKAMGRAQAGVPLPRSVKLRDTIFAIDQGESRATISSEDFSALLSFMLLRFELVGSDEHAEARDAAAWESEKQHRGITGSLDRRIGRGGGGGRLDAPPRSSVLSSEFLSYTLVP